MLLCVVTVLSLLGVVNAHGYHPKAKDMKPDPDWATMHMAGKAPYASERKIDPY
jgi:hypothetical protein